MFKELSLDDLLLQCLKESRELLNTSPMLADYTLFLVAKEYGARGVAIPAEIKKGREEVIQHLNVTYEKKIQKILAEGKVAEAESLFVLVTIQYTKNDQKIPSAFWESREKICAQTSNELFREVYT